VKRGEIYVVDLGPSVGNERGGTRSVVVVSDDVSNLYPYVIAVIVGEDTTTVAGKAGVLVPTAESGALADLVFLTHQVRTLDPSRFPAQPCGVVPPHLLSKITLALKAFLDVP
jgi:mRNA interferase MazF